MTINDADVELDLILSMGGTVDVGWGDAVVDTRPAVCVAAVLRGLDSTSSEDDWNSKGCGQGQGFGYGSYPRNGFGSGFGRGDGDGWGEGDGEGNGEGWGEGRGFGVGHGEGFDGSDYKLGTGLG